MKVLAYGFLHTDATRTEIVEELPRHGMASNEQRGRRYDAADKTLAVACAGPRSQALPTGLVVGERIAGTIEHNGLARCLDGEHLYEPDIAQLPLAMQAREAPDADDRPAHMRILVIDDDPLLLRTLQDILEADGHEVIAAPGGQAGIDAFNCCAGARRAVRSGVDRHGHALCRSGAMPLSRSSPTRMPTS